MSGVPITLSNLANLQNDTSATNTINNNSTSITSAFGSAFYRQGDQMQGNIDMNSNHIYNLPAPATQTEPLRVIDAANLTAGGTINVITRETWPAPADFGAVGDGVHDDTSAIQQLFNSGSDTIYIPAGTFAVHDINVPIGVSRIFGTGALLFNGSPGSTILIFRDFQWDVTVEGLVFESNETTALLIKIISQNSGSKEIKINNCRFFGGNTSIYFSDFSAGLHGFNSCYFTNSYFTGFSSGVLFTDATCVISDLIFSRNFINGDGTATYHALSIGTGSNQTNNNLTITENHFFNSGAGHAISIGNCSGAVIANNNIAMSTNGIEGIIVRAYGGKTVSETSISDNVIYGANSTSQGAGILVGAGDTNASNFVTDVLITGNLIRYVGFQGIHVSAFGANTVNYVTVSGNFIHNPSVSAVSQGIFLGAFSIGGGTVSNCRVTGNTIDSNFVNTNYGIQLDSETSACKVFDNLISLNGGTAFLDSGTGNTSDEGAAAFTRSYSKNNVNVYVNPATGSDVTGDGSSGNPYQTVSFAYYNSAVQLDGGSDGTALIINLANGTYSAQHLDVFAGLVGFNEIELLGNPGNPAAVVFDGTGTSGSCFIMDEGTSGLNLAVNGVQIQNWAGGFETKQMSGSIAVANIIFAGGVGTCFLVQGGGQVQAQGALTWSGNNGKAVYVSGSGSTFDLNASTVNFSGGASFSDYILYPENLGLIKWIQGTVTGTCTGSKFFIYSGGVLRAAFNGGADMFPTDMPGSTNTARLSGGWFNNLLGVEAMNNLIGHVAQLPTSLASLGMRSFVTDATSTTFGALAVGGGSNTVPVYWTGANGWRIG